MKYEATQINNNTYVVEAIISRGWGAAMELQIEEATLTRELVDRPHGSLLVWSARFEDGVVFTNDSLPALVRTVKAELASRLTGRSWIDCFEF